MLIFTGIVLLLSAIVAACSLHEVVATKTQIMSLIACICMAVLFGLRVAGLS
jgi:hypothetical protein